MSLEVEKIPLGEAILAARRQLEELVGKPSCSVVQVEATEEGWRVVMEMLDRKAVPDSMDLLADYEAFLDAGGRLLNFCRRGVRRRIDSNDRES